MLLPRLIPSLLVDSEQHLVKTTNFLKRDYIGEPLNSAYIFSGFEADELMVLDIDASPNNRSISLEFVEALATFTSVPLCVGGGISDLDHIQSLLASGVEKVALSSSLKNNFKLLEKASNRFGSSSISVIINCFKDENALYVGSFGLPSEKSKGNLDEMALLCENAGAGELIINNINLEGTRKGFEIPLLQRLNAKIKIPLVALGGCGDLKHIENLLLATPISGVACGSFLVYADQTHEVLLSYPDKSKWLKKNLQTIRNK